MFIDSVIWIAYKNTRDTWHEKAKTLLPKVLATAERVYVTDYVVLETVNHLLRKTSFQTARETLEMFLSSSRLTLIVNNENTLRATQDFFYEFPGLSITDANIVLHMKKLQEKTLFSFDKGFDQVRGILRKEVS